MKNPEPVENPISNNAPPEAPSAAHVPNEPEEDDDDNSKQASSPKSHSHSHSHDDAKSAPAADVDHPKDYATNAPLPCHQMHAPAPAPPPPPYQPHMMPPPPPFLPSMMMQMPHSHFQLPPYLDHHLLPFSPYAYPMTTFPSAPAPNMRMQKRDWSTGLFDCFSDLKNCLITTIFPCVTFGQVSEILNEGQTPWWEGAISYVLVDMATMSTGTFLCAWTYRAKMRQKNLLNGNILWDLIVTFFFTRFALCQLYRQLDQLGYNVPLGWIANRDKQSHGHGAMQHKFQVVPPPVESGMFR